MGQVSEETPGSASPPWKPGAAWVSSGGGRGLGGKGFTPAEKTLQRSDDCCQRSGGHEGAEKPCLRRNSSTLGAIEWGWGTCLQLQGPNLGTPRPSSGMVERGSSWSSHLPSISVVSVR